MEGRQEWDEKGQPPSDELGITRLKGMRAQGPDGDWL